MQQQKGLPTLMKGQWLEIQGTVINLKSKIQDLNYARGFSSENCTGRGRGGCVGSIFFFFFLLSISISQYRAKLKT